MTAQAGAVAAWVDPDDLADMGEYGVCLDLYPNQIGDAYVPLYAAPPAAVPVEALEALIALWRARTFGHSSHADELTQLIKERSNG